MQPGSPPEETKKHPKITLVAKRNMPPAAFEFFREQGRIGGKLSGAARMRKLSPEQRSAIAKKAVAARELKRKNRSSALPLPPRKMVLGRLKLLDEVSAYLIRALVLEGRTVADLAKTWKMKEADVVRRAQEAIAKLNGGMAP